MKAILQTCWSSLLLENFDSCWVSTGLKLLKLGKRLLITSGDEPLYESLAKSCVLPLTLSTLSYERIWQPRKAVPHFSMSPFSLLLLRSRRLSDLSPANSFSEADGS